MAGGAAAGRATRALVVDDERMNREVIVANLRAAGYETVTAEDGRQAWEILDRLPGDFDVILLDRRMPRMDGMELLNALKADERLRQIPVIMQTAYASSEDVVEGIKAGVYYYLGKPLDRKLLLSVVASAVEEHQRFRRLSEDMEKRSTAMTMMDAAAFHFRTLEEGNRLAVALARVCPNAQFLAVGLSEIFTNAVEHGNLGISYEEKARLIAEKRLANEIEARLDAPQYRDRVVTVLFERSADEVRFLIRDEGEGFDWRGYVELDPTRAFSAHGRGIVMARRLSFDRLEYRDPGNEVLCVVRGVAENVVEAPALSAAKAAVSESGASCQGKGRSPMDEDLKLARTMQTELLPTPQILEGLKADYGAAITGYFETSCELGGDLWGAHAVDDHSFAIWLADFAGHGVTAAMNTFRLHTLVHHIEERADPAAFLGALNQRLAGLLPVGQYTTMLYGVVDMRARQFRYAAAASPPPLVVTTETLEARLGDGAGLPLGVSKNARYRERSLDIVPGSVLFMASDALTESAAEDGGFLGQGGVSDMVRRAVAARGGEVDVNTVLAPFLATVQRPLRDDLTAICCVL